jgi:hypothetical protein
MRHQPSNQPDEPEHHATEPGAVAEPHLQLTMQPGKTVITGA